LVGYFCFCSCVATPPPNKLDQISELNLAGLVQLLDDPDDAVRMFAIGKIQKTTGKTLGYVYYYSSEKRAGAIGRWIAYINAAHKERLGSGSLTP